MNSERENDPKHKRFAAIHEAGHVTVAVCKGYRVRSEVTKGGTGGSAVIDGRFCATGAIAGMVADALAESPSIGAETLIENWLWYRDYISESDLARIPEDRNGRLAAVKEALSILRREKRFYDEVVHELIERENLTADMIDEIRRRIDNTKGRSEQPRASRIFNESQHE